MRLLALKSGPEIMKLLKQLESESKAIIEDIVTITIYSGQSYELIWNTSYEERQLFVKILKDKINLDRGIKPKDVLTQGML
jgi:hypothetical protein